MAFKSEGVRFKSGSRFKDCALNFAASEISRFSKGNDGDASAGVDLTLSAVVSYSAEKNRTNAKEIKTKIREDKRLEKNKKGAGPEKTDAPEGRDENGKKTGKDSSQKPDSDRKSLSKEKKKAAAKTALSKILRAKGMIGNDLASDKATGDALKDGNRGMVRLITEVLNPMTYLKKLFVKIAAALAPHVMIVLMHLILAMILISIVVGMFVSISRVVTQVTGFVTRFFSRSGIIEEEVLTDERIDELVDASGATGRERAVVRFAFSKVGSSFSTDHRVSGWAFDSSSLAYFSWMAAGVDLSYGQGSPPTAATVASRMSSRGTIVNSTRLDKKDLRPGDLIFYGGEENGRFLGIYHTAIYVGNGEVVEALNESHGVVYQTLRKDKIILVLRP